MLGDPDGGPGGLEEEIEPLWHSLGRSLKEEIYFNFGTCSENLGDADTDMRTPNDEVSHGGDSER